MQRLNGPTHDRIKVVILLTVVCLVSFGFLEYHIAGQLPVHCTDWSVDSVNNDSSIVLLLSAVGSVVLGAISGYLLLWRRHPIMRIVCFLLALIVMALAVFVISYYIQKHFCPFEGA